ncbi:hypothetical protein CR159_06245 [Pollutimonas subterranea]|uniref:EF-hand domain-containing protein n=1 Tax=Pollutimonas subterranea TaxID=2045210 RepID=A0A2N4U737_9BURK|nr:EF-hand domain-containing protein [Pollutimonas subterranea]PLC50807.1 hypothetical protein CR159_06245 [Pollutimonas subterranea]
MKRILALAVSVALLGPAAVLAQNGQFELTPEHFAELDKNKSGGVSKDEYEQFMRNAFKKLDTDRNNSLSSAEAGKVMTSDQFATIDANKDGKVTLDEFIQHVMSDFDRQDRNKDGTLQP